MAASENHHWGRYREGLAWFGKSNPDERPMPSSNRWEAICRLLCASCTHDTTLERRNQHCHVTWLCGHQCNTLGSTSHTRTGLLPQAWPLGSPHLQHLSTDVSTQLDKLAMREASLTDAAQGLLSQYSALRQQQAALQEECLR
jgi:hypothetical protein